MLAWVLTRVPWADTRAAFTQLRLGPLVLAVAVIVAGQVVRAVRTCALVRGGVRAADLPPMLRMQMLAFLPGMLSPAKAGELVKVELLRRQWGISLARGTAAFFTERLADVLVLGAAAAWGLGGVFGQAIPPLAYAGAAAPFVAGVAAYWVWRGDRLPAAWRARIRDGLGGVQWTPVVGASVVYWFLVVGIVWLFARSAGSDVPFLALAGAVPLCLLTALLPVSFGGFGVREGAMVVAFQHAAVGCTAAQAVAISLLYDVVGLGVPALMGVTYMLARPRHG